MKVRNNTNGNLSFSARHLKHGEKGVPHSILLIAGATTELEDSVWSECYADTCAVAVASEALTILIAPAMSLEVEMEAAEKAMKAAEKVMEAATVRKTDAAKADKAVKAEADKK